MSPVFFLLFLLFSMVISYVLGLKSRARMVTTRQMKRILQEEVNKVYYEERQQYIATIERLTNQLRQRKKP